MNDRPRSRRAAPRAGTSEPAIGGPSLDIRIQSRRWREVADLRPRIVAAVEAALALAPVKLLPEAELSLLLTDDKRIRIVNRDWRGFDKATNVLSFPAAPPEKISSSPAIGDIVLAFETVAREAEAEEKPFGDHLSHLVIHGLLHLIGEDHETEDQAERMEAIETSALARLGIADPYAGSDPEPIQPPPTTDKNTSTQPAS
ncbi:rRNA maturation RNase YbeY [Bosea vestrisii]|uniref:rRNA maturation RNase YbeY n=1 Tax=Bosea vestrisii TaxID=151416 RepID=UPI0024DF788D|nr:rRNA maturation RNase YbeY [Bosea vestrisii]WID94396.1 rRNA maturation RNase YbeY [Bosea vestrisii]